MGRVRAVTRRMDRDDSGLSLAELLLSMAVFGIVLTAVAAVLLNTLQTTRYAQVKTATTADTRIAMEAMTRTLRVALVPAGEPSAFVLADTDEVAFYSSLSRGPGQNSERPTLVTYTYDSTSGCLNERQVLAVPTGNPLRPLQWTGAATTSCLIRTFTPPSFSYFDDGRLTEDDGSAVAPLAVPADGFSSSRAAAAMGTIISVEISVDLQDPDAVEVNGVQARDRVTLSNVQTALNLGG